jgi:hypothetical protein
MEDYQWEDLDDKAHQLWTPSKTIFLRQCNTHPPDNDEMQRYLCNALHHMAAPSLDQHVPAFQPLNTESTDIYQNDEYVLCTLLMSSTNWMINTYEHRPLIASLQWAPIPLGRLDIKTAVILTLSFLAPLRGHPHRTNDVKRYLARCKNGSVRFCTRIPIIAIYPNATLDRTFWSVLMHHWTYPLMQQSLLMVTQSGSLNMSMQTFSITGFVAIGHTSIAPCPWGMLIQLHTIPGLNWDWYPVSQRWWTKHNLICTLRNYQLWRLP